MKMYYEVFHERGGCKYFDDLPSEETATFFLRRTPADKWCTSPFRGYEGEPEAIRLFLSLVMQNIPHFKGNGTRCKSQRGKAVKHAHTHVWFNAASTFRGRWSFHYSYLFHTHLHQSLSTQPRYISYLHRLATLHF